MPWIRIDENAMDHPKVACISDSAFRLWMMGLAHCQRFLTDGLIISSSMRGLRFYTARRATELVSIGLWDQVPGGIQVHDYLDWNESRETVIVNREWNKRRREMYSDPGMLAAIRNRDGDRCRYCGKVVNWRDRRGPDGGTYDHIVARGPNTVDNLVVACRGCNSSKGDRSLAECGMSLLSIPKSIPELVPSQNGSSHHIGEVGDVTGSSQQPSSAEREGGPGETTPEQRAGDFCEWYAEAHRRHIGVGYIGNPNSDYMAALRLVSKFLDSELRDAALVWFGQDDDFAKKGTRTIPKFASRASDCVLQARRIA